MKNVIILLSLFSLGWLGCGDDKDKVLGSNDNDVINIVRVGYFADHPSPEQTIGQAVEDFFGNPKWVSLVAEDGNTYVNLTGKITFLDEEVDALVQFRVDKEAGTFIINAFEMNGIPQNDAMKLGLVEALYEED